SVSLLLSADLESRLVLGERLLEVVLIQQDVAEKVVHRRQHLLGADRLRTLEGAACISRRVLELPLLAKARSQVVRGAERDPRVRRAKEDLPQPVLALA